MKTRKTARVLVPLLLCLAALLPLVTGCNDDDPTPPSRSQQGGAIQGIPLALTTAVTTFAGTAGTWGDNDAIGVDARFNEPYDVTTDGEYLFLTEKSGRRIRKIAIDNAEVTTLVNANLSEPVGMTTDGTFLYVCDREGSIRKVAIDNGEMTTIAGGNSGGFLDNATGTDALFNQPYGITTDGRNLYVADRQNHAVRKISLTAPYAVTTLAGTGVFGSADNTTGTSATFYEPRGITTDGRDLYVTDWLNHTIRKVSLTAPYAVTTIAGQAGVNGTADNTTGTSATFNRPRGITTDGVYLYVADYWNHLVRKVAISAPHAVTTLAGTGSIGTLDNTTGTLASFEDVCGITTDGFSLFVTDRSANTVRRIR